jgi:hypothetical protein
MSKQVATATNGFDPVFFMYGEDIDLSYRIQQLGFKNYYFAGSSIIHFKGESAIQQSFKHNQMFYKAMLVFVQKHYGGSKASLFSLLLQMGIWARSVLGFIGRVFRSSTKSLQKKQPRSLLFFGSGIEVAGAQQSFKEQNSECMVVVADPYQQLQAIHNKDVVFCESNDLTNSTILQLVNQLPEANNYWFHASGSRCIVGSHSSNNLGNVIEQNGLPR